MKEFLKKAATKIVLFLKEIGNFIGNVFAPVVSVLVAIASLLQMPIKVIEGLKKFEYWLFKVGGTLPAIEKEIERLKGD